MAKTITTNMPKGRPVTRRHKKAFYVSCAVAVLALAAAISATIIQSIPQPITEDYFVSDDTKTVIPLTTNGNNTYLVYTHDGDIVTGLKTYFKYADQETAKNTFEVAKDQPELKNASLNGQYIVVTADESQYKGLTVSDIKQQTEALHLFQNTNQAK
jgi:secreted protein with Ig-like and vWFA domain